MQSPVPPCTRVSLAADLAGLSVRGGDVLLLHSSLRSLGWVCGGAVAVVQALLDVLGPRGTLVVPAQTPNNRDPSKLSDPAIPEHWWPHFRAHAPAFDPALTPSETVGIIAERVRTWPAAVRSAHPQTSFAAVGAQAVDLMRDHRLTSHLGDHSPLARLEAIGARVLLLGVGFDRTTAFHLAEHRMPGAPTRDYSCAMLTPQGRRWITYQDVALDDSDFPALGRDFAQNTGAVQSGVVGAAKAHVFGVREAVAFATKWFSVYREHAGHP